MSNKIEISELNPLHWKPAYVFPDYYLISDNGEAYSIRTKTILKPHVGKVGYGYYVFSVEGKRHTVKAHKLVAMAFVPNPDDKLAIDHINGIKTDNRVSNLRWVTVKENNQNPNTLPNLMRGLAKSRKPVAVYKGKEMIGIFDSRKAAAKAAGVCPQTVSQCICDRRKDTTQARGYTFKSI